MQYQKMQFAENQVRCIAQHLQMDNIEGNMFYMMIFAI